MRNQHGMSLIEMLSALFITAFIGAIMSEIAVTQNVVALKTSNKMDSLVAGRRFIAGFERDVHMARSIVSATPTSFQLETPEYITSGTQVGLPQQANSTWLVDTSTYSIQSDTDPSKAGEFLLQKQTTTSTTSQTFVLASGIVGPMDPSDTSKPKIFRYYQKISAGVKPQLVDAPSAGFSSYELSQIVGVRVTLEIAATSTSRSDIASKSFAFASDAFTRTNLGAL